jgi:hypothetical protein
MHEETYSTGLIQYLPLPQAKLHVLATAISYNIRVSHCHNLPQPRVTVLGASHGSRSQSRFPEPVTVPGASYGS